MNSGLAEVSKMGEGNTAIHEVDSFAGDSP